MKSSETKKKCPYVERDISWMYFNQRILLEAARPEVPLLLFLCDCGTGSSLRTVRSVQIVNRHLCLCLKDCLLMTKEKALEKTMHS